jgi:hypothetical protein
MVCVCLATFYLDAYEKVALAQTNHSNLDFFLKFSKLFYLFIIICSDIDKI